MFTSVVCGLDGSRQSFESARQAARLTLPGGQITLVAVVDFFDALAMRHADPAFGHRAGAAVPDASELVEALHERAAEWLREATRQIGAGRQVATRVAEGRAADALRDEATRIGASMIAVGACGTNRLACVALGRTGSLLLHEAPCAVLVTRPPFDSISFPRRAVVGVDGSAGSQEAMRSATAIAAAHGTELQVVTAGDGDAVEADAVKKAAGSTPMRVVHGRPVEALVEAAEYSDLLIVGKRGLHGARALGSVSERVAHRAASSVLVVSARPVGGD